MSLPKKMEWYDFGDHKTTEGGSCTYMLEVAEISGVLLTISRQGNECVWWLESEEHAELVIRAFEAPETLLALRKIADRAAALLVEWRSIAPDDAPYYAVKDALDKLEAME